MIIDGKKIADKILAELKKEILKQAQGKALRLASVLVGPDPGSKKFLELKQKAAEKIGIARILAALRMKKFDVVNNQFGWRLIPFHKLITSPFITTLQTPLDQLNKQITFREYRQALFITVSKSQRKSLPYLDYLATIYNGIDINLYDFSLKPDDYFVFLGRMSPEKGILEAIQIVKKLKAKLIIASAIHGWDREYFFSKIKPHIDGKYIQFIGEVSDPKKINYSVTL